MKWAWLLLVACGGAHDEDLFPERGDAGQARQPQETPVDCRPVRVTGCYDGLNDRACFHRPPGCALTGPAE